MKKMIISLVVFVLLIGWAGSGSAWYHHGHHYYHHGYGNADATAGLLAGALIGGCAVLTATAIRDANQAKQYQSPYARLPQEERDRLWNEYCDLPVPRETWQDFLRMKGVI